MAGELDKLYRLQVIDLDLLKKKREVAGFEEKLGIRRKALESCVARIDQESSRRKVLVNERALAERRVSDSQVMLKERRSRVARITTERELRAGESEIHTIIEEIDGLEEKLLVLMEQVDEVEAVLAELRKEKADLEEADHRQVEAEASRIEALRGELEAERAERDGVAAGVDGGLRRRYELILERRGGLAVVRVEEGSCKGCHMRVPSQTLIEIMKTGAVHVCPSCQRILYVK